MKEIKWAFNEVLPQFKGAKQPITEWTSERKITKKQKVKQGNSWKKINSNIDNCKKNNIRFI